MFTKEVKVGLVVSLISGAVISGFGCIVNAAGSKISEKILATPSPEEVTNEEA